MFQPGDVWSGRVGLLSRSTTEELAFDAFHAVPHITEAQVIKGLSWVKRLEEARRECR